MRATFNSLDLACCTEAKLQDWYHTSVGTLSDTTALEVKETSFNLYSKAEDWLHNETTNLPVAMAVRLYNMPDLSEAEAKKMAHWTEKRNIYEKELHEYPQMIIQRVKSGKCKTRGCECGTQIAVAQIQELTCRYCGADFLTSNTDINRMEYLTDKFNEASRELDGLREKLIRKAKDKTWKWVVGWWSLT